MSNLTIVEDPARLLDGIKSDIEPLLMENGKSFDRLKSVFLIAVQQEPKILQCTPESLIREISKCAADGLVPDGKEAVLLPYYDNKERAHLANYQPMVHGIIKRLRELGEVFSITCKLVHENDEFILNEADPDSLEHKSDPFSTERGEVVGGYAVFRDDQKRVMHLETMSLEDFDKVRKASKAPDSPAWRNWRNEMYRKAVLRRGSKYISVNNDKIRTLLERQDDMFDFQNQRITERVNPFVDSGQQVIEGSAATSTVADRKLVEDSVATSDKPEPKGQPQAKAEQTVAIPDCPDINIHLDDLQTLTEAVEAILSTALVQGGTPLERRKGLKSVAARWSESVPEYARTLVKACIDVSDWALKQDAAGKPWTADHAMFAHKVKSAMGVEKLNIGKYP